MKIGKQFRALAVRAEDVARASGEGADPDVIEFPFSSEEPVERYFGDEVLSHDPSAADLSRVNGGAAPFLWNHDTNQPIGMVLSGGLRGKRGFAKAKFFSTPFAQEKKQQMLEGLRNISFGYQIVDADKTRDASGDKPAEITVTKWAVHEVSLVSVPADYKAVGVGRAESEDGIEISVLNETISNEITMGAMKMTEAEKKALEDQQRAEQARITAEARNAERARQAAITALGEKFKLPELARELANSDKSVEQVREAFLEKLGAVQKPINSGNEADVGLTEKEARQFSFLKIMNALANPNDRKAQEGAKFEREVSEAEAKRSGKTPRGFLVPVDVLRSSGMQKRDMTAGSSSGGGYSVATDLDSASFVELLRNKMVMQRLGCRVLNGLSSNVSIPKLASSSTAYWVAENSAVTESAPALGQISLAPKTVGGFVDISRRLLIQSDLSVDNLVKGDLAAVIGLAIDAKALYGDGSSNTITGVRYATGLKTVDFANADPTYAEIIAMETAIAAANADVSGMKYLTNANGRGVLKGIYTNATYGEIPVWKDNQVNGYAAEVSNQSSKLSSVDYDYWFADWSQAMLAFFSGLDIMVDPYTGGTAGTVRIIALQDVDFAVRHGESFCYGNKTIA